MFALNYVPSPLFFLSLILAGQMRCCGAEQLQSQKDTSADVSEFTTHKSDKHLLIRQHSLTAHSLLSCLCVLL